MNLILLLPEDRVDNDHYCFDDHRAEHIRSILGRTIGDQVEIGLINGPRGSAEIVACDSGAVELVVRQLREMIPPTPTVDLVCALPRPQTLKRVLATCGTMGIRQLHLVRANRVERSYYQSPLLQPDNMKQYLIEGMMQGRQTRLPEVTIHQRFRPFFEDGLPALVANEAQAPLMLVAEGEVTATITDVWPNRPAWIVAAVGPEGGWVPFELEILQSQGFLSVSLGRWVLRVEAAVVALLSQIELQVAIDRSNR